MNTNDGPLATYDEMPFPDLVTAQRLHQKIDLQDQLLSGSAPPVREKQGEPLEEKHHQEGIANEGSFNVDFPHSHSRASSPTKRVV